MPSFRDNLITVLTEGIGGLIDDGGDGGQPTTGGTSSPARPETTSPEPQLQDREPFLQTVTRGQILIGTVVLVAAIGFLAFARR